jgi:hypothetical protein
MRMLAGRANHRHIRIVIGNIGAPLAEEVHEHVTG